MVATRVPSTSVTAGAKASSSSAPIPTTASSGRAAAAARRVDGSRARPKSRAWLLAMLATSIPAAASASKAAVPAEKVNRFPGSGRPPEPTDVSRLTIARSAAASAAVAGANAEAGRRRRGASAPSKCTSPATAMSTGAGRGSRGAGAAVVGGGARSSSLPGHGTSPGTTARRSGCSPRPRRPRPARAPRRSGVRPCRRPRSWRHGATARPTHHPKWVWRRGRTVTHSGHENSDLAPGRPRAGARRPHGRAGARGVLQHRRPGRRRGVADRHLRVRGQPRRPTTCSSRCASTS